MFDHGYVRIGSWRGAPLRVHWSVLPAAWVFGRFHFDPVLFAAFFALVLIHELGHATIVRATGNQLLSVDVHGLGGACVWSGAATGLERSAIAWGGVLAQALLYAGTSAWLRVRGVQSNEGATIAAVFLSTNAYLMAINLMPIPPLDGAQAWKLFSYIPWRSWLPRRWRRTAPPKRVSTALPAPLVTPPPKVRRALPGDGEAPDPPVPEELRRAVERIFEESRQRRG